MEMMILEQMAKHIDKFGIIAQADGDQGDSAQREGMLLLAAAYYYRTGRMPAEEYATITSRGRAVGSLLINPDGLVRRGVDETKWYSHWDRGSRDQYHIVIGLSAAALTDLVAKIRAGHRSRLYLYTTNFKGNGDTNRLKIPDLTGIGFYSYYIRTEKNPNKLLLHLADLSLLANSLIWKIRGKSEDVDILNHLQALVYAHMYHPTFISKFAAKIFASMEKLRDGPENAIQQRLDHYFRPESGGITAMADIYAIMVKEIFYGKDL